MDWLMKILFLSIKGTQKSVSCAEVGVGTSNIPFSTSQPFLSSTPIKRPCKRARLELEEEEEEDPLEGSSFMDIPDPKDSTYNPEESVTVLSESVDVTWVNNLKIAYIFFYIISLK